jgi:hypothetical protein
MIKRLVGIVALVMPLLSYAHDYEHTGRSHQECWTEPTHYRGRDDVGAIIGGIAGGIIGNQVGRGTGRIAATAVGAGAGAIVGDRLANREGYRGGVRRCRTVVDHVRLPVRTREIMDTRDMIETPEMVESYYVSSRPIYTESIGAPGYYPPVDYRRPGGRYHHHDYHRHHYRHYYYD